MRGVPGAFRIIASSTLDGFISRRLIDGARARLAARWRVDGVAESPRRLVDEATHGIDPAQETKLRLGVALFPDRLLDKPRGDDVK